MKEPDWADLDEEDLIGGPLLIIVMLILITVIGTYLWVTPPNL